MLNNNNLYNLFQDPTLRDTANLLYEPMSSLSEIDSSGPREIKTGEMDSGEDLTYGILAVDGARVLLNTVRRGVKDLK
jgi:hypothetical protein